MFTWLLPLLTALLALSWSPVARACKCAEPPAPSAALANAQAVFKGEVAAIQDTGSDFVVTLRVPEAWKGIDSAEQIRVRTPKDSAACGFAFALGEYYLVYAEALEPAQDGVALKVLRCGRTRALADADADLRELGLGSIPVNVDAPSELPELAHQSLVERKRLQPAAGGCASCSVGGPRMPGWLGLGLGAGLTLFAARRRAARRR